MIRKLPALTFFTLINLFTINHTQAAATPAGAGTHLYDGTGRTVAVPTATPVIDRTRYATNTFTAQDYCPAAQCTPTNCAKDVFGRTHASEPLPGWILALETSSDVRTELKAWIKDHKEKQVLYYVHDGMPTYLKRLSYGTWVATVVATGIAGIVELAHKDETTKGAALLATAAASVIVPQLEKWTVTAVDWAVRQTWHASSFALRSLSNAFSSCASTKCCQGTVFELCCSGGQELISQTVLDDLKAAQGPKQIAVATAAAGGGTGIALAIPSAPPAKEDV